MVAAHEATTHAQSSRSPPTPLRLRLQAPRDLCGVRDIAVDRHEYLDRARRAGLTWEQAADAGPRSRRSGRADGRQTSGRSPTRDVGTAADSVGRLFA